MMNKIAFLCVNPWEKFLPVSYQGFGKKYYEHIRKMAHLKQRSIVCREYRELYGEVTVMPEQPFFPAEKEFLQLLYIQSSRAAVLKKVFQTADLVFIGTPGSMAEFEKVYPLIYPWKDKALFLWDSDSCAEEHFQERLIRECGLRSTQMIEMGKECRKNIGG